MSYYNNPYTPNAYGYTPGPNGYTSAQPAVWKVKISPCGVVFS